jgi:hypothetical protein
LALSPAIQYEYISGGDLLANSIFLLLFLLLAIRVFAHSASPAWAKPASAVKLGIGLASRANFFLLVQQLFAVVCKQAGFKAAAKCVLTACITAGSAILQFHLYDPASFGPFTIANKLAAYNAFLPFSSSAIILSALGLSIALSAILWKPSSKRSEALFFGMSAVVQLFPMLCGMLLDAIKNGGLDFRIMQHRYGLMFLFFGLWGCWAYLSGVRRADRPGHAVFETA